MTISTEETVFAPETTTNVCPCGVKHDEFVLPVGRFQFCPEENMLYVLEYPETFCDVDHNEPCELLHYEDHDHVLNSDLSCGVSSMVKCTAHYTGGVWKRPDA